MALLCVNSFLWSKLRSRKLKPQLENRHFHDKLPCFKAKLFISFWLEYQDEFWKLNTRLNLDLGTYIAVMFQVDYAYRLESYSLMGLDDIPAPLPFFPFFRSLRLLAYKTLDRFLAFFLNETDCFPVLLKIWEKKDNKQANWAQNQSGYWIKIENNRKNILTPRSFTMIIIFMGHNSWDDQSNYQTNNEYFFHIDGD